MSRPIRAPPGWLLIWTPGGAGSSGSARVNYPSAAQRANLDGNPVVEVALLRDGKLQSAKIQRSSGHPEIDAAALEILRLASPFDPFPRSCPATTACCVSPTNGSL